MDITPVDSGRTVPAIATPATPETSPAKTAAADNRAVTPVASVAKVAQAVDTLNGSQVFGQENCLSIQRDKDSNTMVLQVVNQKTREVVLQIPSAYALRLAEDVRQQEKKASLLRIG